MTTDNTRMSAAQSEWRDGKEEEKIEMEKKIREVPRSDMGLQIASWREEHKKRVSSHPYIPHPLLFFLL